VDTDPFALAARQTELDRDALTSFPWLTEQKKRRLSASPFAFLRGSAPLFYEILANRPELAAGPKGDGWIVGDMHLENVGAYRDDAGEVVFGLNDFDDTTIGPLRYDVLRFSTSVLLAGRTFRATGAEAIALVEHAVAAYLNARSGGSAPETPAPITDLIERVRGRSKKDLLNDRAPLVHGKRSFVDAGRYHNLPPEIAARVPALLSAYVAALADRSPSKASEWTVEASAFRIAGNGSLGVLRIAIIVRDSAGDERLIELKQYHEPSTSRLFAAPAGHWTHPGERAASAARALCAAPPRQLAPLQLEDWSFVGRRLFPQEDKLAVEKMRVGANLESLVAFIGHVLGQAHARGVTALGGRRLSSWTGAEIASIVDHAVVLSALFEGAYLAWARRNL
jgi:uncharacterized protein (DUF2252 family)